MGKRQLVRAGEQPDGFSGLGDMLFVPLACLDDFLSIVAEINIVI